MPQQTNQEANRLNDQAVALRVANSKLDLRIVQLDRTTKSLLQDMKKVGPNLKDVRLKLNKNWIPVWLKKPTDFRPTTRMPNFRLNDEQIRAISAYLWQSALPDQPVKHAPGNAGRGKELFETRGCLACHSIGEGDQMQGGTFAANLTRVGEKANYDYLVRWVHNARAAHASLLSVREKGYRPRRLREERFALCLRPRTQQVSERRPRTASPEHDGHAQPAAHRAGCVGRGLLPDHPEEEGAEFLSRCAFHGRSQAEGRRQEVDSPLRLRRMP